MVLITGHVCCDGRLGGGRVAGGVQALEALGLALEGYFHILLPSLVRLLPAVNTTVTPKEIKRSVLATMAKLLPRMRIAPHASAVLHPLIVTLRDTREPEVASDALHAICSVAVAIGDNMMLFVPSIASVLAQVQAQLGAAALPMERWNRLVYALQRGEAPCVSREEPASWDDASGWAAELDRVTYNHRLGDPPENPPAPQHRGVAPPPSPPSSPPTLAMPRQQAPSHAQRGAPCSVAGELEEGVGELAPLHEGRLAGVDAAARR